METLNVYVGKELVKFDLGKLLEVDVEVWDRLTYQTAKKHQDLIPAIEICIEDCLGTTVNITDETSFKLAIADLVNIINQDDEEGGTVDTTMTIDDPLTNKTNKEENDMGMINKKELEMATQELLGKLNEGKEALKMKAGQTAEEYIEQSDDAYNCVKGAFMEFLDKADRLVGFSACKENILKVLEKGKTATSQHDIFAMAEECRHIVDRYIQKVELLGNPDDAKTLKELFGQCKQESIFTKFFVTVRWMGKKIARKLRQLFQVDEEKSVIGALCRSLAGIAELARAGLTLIWNTGKFGVSFLLCGVMVLLDIVVSAIKTVVSSIVGWVTKKNKIIEEDDDDFDDFEDVYEA
jgi:hypothetical protein